MGTAIHANRVARTGFDAQAAIDAAQGIDFVTHREFLDGINRIFTGFDVDTLGRAGGCAEKASGAICGVIFAESQAVAPAKGIRVRSSFLRILDCNVGLKSFRQTKGMQDMDAEITPEVITGDRQAAQDFRYVSSLPERHFFNSFHSFPTGNKWL